MTYPHHMFMYVIATIGAILYRWSLELLLTWLKWCLLRLVNSLFLLHSDTCELPFHYLILQIWLLLHTTPYKCNHAALYFCGWFISLNNVLEVHSCHCPLHNFLLFKLEWYSIVCVYHTLFIHLNVNRHLGCLHILTIMNMPQWT